LTAQVTDRDGLSLLIGVVPSQPEAGAFLAVG
jgi:hypothetical protein